jgi:arylsulfatase A-like enzyme
VKTPAFDRVAREGVLFQSAFVSAPSCTPSRLAVATGQWHWRLEDGAHLGGSLKAGVPVYPELLQAAGYEIGFARKGAEPSTHQYTRRDPFGPRFKTFDEFLAQRKARAPFCFWYGAGEPHRPYRFGEGARAGLDPARARLPGCLPDNETTRRDFADYLFRIQRYDAECARLLALMEALGELEHTIVVMSGDNGMPFPRCKATLYDAGTHVPLAVRWGRSIKGGRTITDFVSVTDLAATLLEAAGLKPPPEMTGRSLMPILLSEKSGALDATRTAVLRGMERHVFSQPARAIRTAGFLYIRNFALASWPRIEDAEPLPRIDYARGEWVAQGKAFPLNLEQSPTLQLLLDHRDDPAVRPYYTRAAGARPAEELYDLGTDPDQVQNVAGEPRYALRLAALRGQLTAALRATGDPRLNELGVNASSP